MKTVRFEEIDSTNSYLEREACNMEAPVMVIAGRQTAGRGQRGNSWESEPGKNLTFSVLIRPEEFRAAEQFSISEAAALAITDFLSQHGVSASVKWPNDIYVGDRKICGILIKHTLSGQHIGSTIIGAGVNINQTEFLSDAPNPVSLRQLTGRVYDLETLTCTISECMERRLGMIYGLLHREALHTEFMSRLWRGDGCLHPFRDSATGEAFEASIDNIGMDGVLTLRRKDTSTRQYLFKEVSFIVNCDIPGKDKNY